MCRWLAYSGSPVKLEEFLLKPKNSLVVQSKHSKLGATTTNGDPSMFHEIEGSTDSEMLFFLALTFGLVEDPPGAVARAVGLVEATAERHGIETPVQMTVATTDGDTTWAFRYSSEHRSRSLFHSTDVSMLREQYPDNPVLHDLSDDTRLVVSEPLGDLRGAWHEVPESTCVVVRGAHEELLPFAPVGP